MRGITEDHWGWGHSDGEPYGAEFDGGSIPRRPARRDVDLPQPENGALVLRSVPRLAFQPSQCIMGVTGFFD